MIKLACTGSVGEADCVRDSERVEEGGKGGLLEPVGAAPAVDPGADEAGRAEVVVPAGPVGVAEERPEAAPLLIRGKSPPGAGTALSPPWLAGRRGWWWEQKEQPLREGDRRAAYIVPARHHHT
jgi:hypothetical protein